MPKKKELVTNLEGAREYIAALENEVKECRAELREQSKVIDAFQTHTPPVPPSDPLESLLSHEGTARSLAAGWPADANSDAVKAALTNAAHGIAHVRKALDNNRRLA